MLNFLINHQKPFLILWILVGPVLAGLCFSPERQALSHGIIGSVILAICYCLLRYLNDSSWCSSATFLGIDQQARTSRKG